MPAKSITIDENTEMTPLQLLQAIAEITGVQVQSQEGDISLALWVELPLADGRLLTIQTHDSYAFYVHTRS